MQETKEKVFDQSLTQLNKSTIDSREVAAMCDKEHSKLLRDIRGYCDVLAEAKIGLGEFFLEGTYVDRNNQERPCYLLTRKGCDMVANKMTGEKGIIFTAKYVTRFEEMEEALKQQQPILTQGLSPQLQLLINMELEQKKIKEQAEHATATAIEAKETAEHATKQLESVKDAMLLDHDSWRRDCNNILNKVAKKRGATKEAYKEVKDEAYKLTEQRAGANLKQRVINKQDRLRREGLSKSKIDAVSKIDVIAEDKRLKEIYIAAVKEMAIKYGVA